MGFRWRAFSLHMLASFSLLTVVLLVFYFGWYRWPGWYLVGAEVVVGMLVFVDLGLGPLATLVVSNPAKARPVWRRDLAVIVLVQVIALGYGVRTLWEGRPLLEAFSEDRISIVVATDFKDETLEQATREGARVVPGWSSMLQWIWAPLPDDPDERSRIIASAFATGEDVTVMPKYYRSWSEGKAALNQALIPVERLAKIRTIDQQDYQSWLNDLRRSPAEVGVLPASGTLRSGTWVFDRQTGEPLAFWPVVIWGLTGE